MAHTRRTFLQESTAAAVLAAGTAAGQTRTSPEAAAREAQAFVSNWQNCLDRVWLGADYWANRLQDWRVAGGRIECREAAPNRNVHLLTRQLSPEPGDLTMSVRLGRIGGKLSDGPGSAGFRIGIQGPLKEYRNSLVFGQGLDAGITSAGRLFVGNPGGGVPVEAGVESVELRLSIAARGAQCDVTLSAYDASGKELARTGRSGIPADTLAGNIALVANFGGGGGGKGKKGKAKAEGGEAPAGQFWFADWKLSGSKLVANNDQHFGPILFNHYSLSFGTLKMTAQMPPLGPEDSQKVRLEVQRDGQWQQLSEATIQPAARIAVFRQDNWDATRDVPYRLAYTLKAKDGTSSEYHWTGTIRRDPVDQPVLTVADISCNIHEAFPNHQYTANTAKLNPDFLAFVGDQFYESTGGYGVQRSPLEPATLDYLRKWYLHGWTWRELTRDRPSVSLPDDHDVYQGNNWGEGGAPQTTTQEAGGYNMPAPWVNVVHATQTSHHPDPWDPTPGKQGITVYGGPLTYGRVSFAILADRQFKTGPEGEVPPTGGRGDHVTDPNFDPKTADVPGLQLLGESQMKHLRQWVRDWRGADMKAVISQTIFTAMATTHGSPNGRLVADYDTNGWPQTERNAALREIRKAFAFHIAGDQHLPALVHYGIDEHRDAGLAFAGPAVNTGYPRWFEPERPGENREPGAPETTGDFRDSFGHPMTVLALVNGSKQPRTTVLEKLQDKASGLGLVRFDKKNGTITVECWPFLADPTQPGTQFPGWPRKLKVEMNYGRKPAAWLPRLEIEGAENPLVEVIDERTDELVYALRVRGARWQPWTFAEGNYTVRISDPDAGKRKDLVGMVAKKESSETHRVTL